MKASGEWVFTILIFFYIVPRHNKTVPLHNVHCQLMCFFVAFCIFFFRICDIVPQHNKTVPLHNAFGQLMCLSVRIVYAAAQKFHAPAQRNLSPRFYFPIKITYAAAQKFMPRHNAICLLSFNFMQCSTCHLYE